eukprot:CAMPEP_0172443320 /NCGR_PEP_ID=MMETSP1065-20121228/3615_1 /TAXON_ID=265537 /ORGANISM="Amphiprora paludosa, Strain CCMP125" /LENGTH=308 /DNA_ID=CAMNT_0013193523 /DNA_START=104 /DNA_END=1030 /DNA_ORIENTATION=+
MMKSGLAFGLGFILVSQVASFLPIQQWFASPHGRSIKRSMSAVEARPATSSKAVELKEELLRRIDNLRTAQILGGDFSVDFGVEGGELNETSRAPQKLDFYSISDSVGYAADQILDTCEELAAMSPTAIPTEFLGDRRNGNDSPLNGPWKLLFSTAADATFSKNSTRGDAKVQNVVNARRGRITNVIDFLPGQGGETPLVKQLNVVIKAKALSEKRVELNFKYAKAVFSRFFGIPIKWSLYIPVPVPFITRMIVFFNRVFRKKNAQMPPKAYFDVIYLDDDLRIHRTGEDNIFVQAKENWDSARYLTL